MFQLSNGVLKRISKQSAAKLHANGGRVYLLPCRTRLDTPWMRPYLVNPDEDFEKTVNSYTYYNCNAELGKYCSYFVEE